MRQTGVPWKSARRKTDERAGDKSIGDSCRHSSLKRYRSLDNEAPTGDTTFRTERKSLPAMTAGVND